MDVKSKRFGMFLLTEDLKKKKLKLLKEKGIEPTEEVMEEFDVDSRTLLFKDKDGKKRWYVKIFGGLYMDFIGA